tara:strand:- start:444 stop:851 length:408 start_codon:yes stop_codon:yes gene_type:complete
MKKDLNYIAKIEQAIAKKYGEKTVQHPRANWTTEKEKDYLNQIKKIYNRQKKSKQDEKTEANGFLVSEKLLNKESDRVCPACFEYSFNMRDDLYMNKYDCCYGCYIQFVEGRETRWFNLTERVEFLASYYNQGEI